MVAVFDGPVIIAHAHFGQAAEKVGVYIVRIPADGPVVIHDRALIVGPVMFGSTRFDRIHHVNPEYIPDGRWEPGWYSFAIGAVADRSAAGPLIFALAVSLRFRHWCPSPRKSMAGVDTLNQICRTALPDAACELGYDYQDLC